MSDLSDPAGVTPSQRLATVDDMLLYRLGLLTGAAGVMVVRLCEGGYGITRREWSVLAQLHGQPQGLLPSVLAERMQRDRARTSRALSALQAKGLVQRMVLPHDRRSVRVSLTAAGQALYDELMPQVQSINARILEVLDPAQKEALDGILQQLRLQARHLLAEMDPQLPKADRRRGGRKDA
jgi:DNA-binding MarR family transcriptional regulator